MDINRYNIVIKRLTGTYLVLYCSRCQKILLLNKLKSLFDMIHSLEFLNSIQHKDLHLVSWEYSALGQILTKTISNAVSYHAEVGLWLASLFSGGLAVAVFPSKTVYGQLKETTKSLEQIIFK